MLQAKRSELYHGRKFEDKKGEQICHQEFPIPNGSIAAPLTKFYKCLF